jgi:hypothetical protein
MKHMTSEQHRTEHRDDGASAQRRAREAKRHGHAQVVVLNGAKKVDGTLLLDTKRLKEAKVVERYEANQEQRLSVAKLRHAIDVEVLPTQDILHLGIELGVHGGASGARDESRCIDCPLDCDFESPALSEGCLLRVGWAMLPHSHLIE